MADPTDTPVIIGKTLPAIVVTILRYLAGFLGAGAVGVFLAAHGLTFGRDPSEVIGAVLTAVVTVAWGAYRTWRNNEKAKAMANMLPDTKALVR